LYLDFAIHENRVELAPLDELDNDVSFESGLIGCLITYKHSGAVGINTFDGKTIGGFFKNDGCEIAGIGLQAICIRKSFSLGFQDCGGPGEGSIKTQ
jgi:hypothetical protein